MSIYDTTIVYNPQIEESGIDGEIKKAREIIERHGGKIVTENRIGMRRLAYEIQKTFQGFYYRFTYDGSGQVINELERQLRMDEPCLRFLTCLHQGEMQMEQEHPNAAEAETAEKSTEEYISAEETPDDDSEL